MEESKTVSLKIKKESYISEFFGAFEDIDSEEMIRSI
jgi:hypothetical protein